MNNLQSECDQYEEQLQQKRSQIKSYYN